MSNPNNTNNAGGGSGLGLGAANPALLNANAVLAQLAQATGRGVVPVPSPIPNTGGMNMTPEQLRQLTEYHRQTAAHLAQTQAQGSPGSAPPRPLNPAPAAAPSGRPAWMSLLPQHILRHISSPNLSTADRNAFLSQWMATEDGRALIAQHQQRQLHAAQLAQAQQQQKEHHQRHASAGASPNRPPLGLPVPSLARRRSSTSPQRPPGAFISPSNLHPALSSSPLHSFVSLPGGGGPSAPDQSAAPVPTGTSRPNNVPLNPTSTFSVRPNPPAPTPPPAPVPSTGNSRPGSSSGPQGPSTPAPSAPHAQQQREQQAPARRPANSPEPVARPAPSRRREEGMRGTMRAELARLMYASGDVENPDLDSIDYMEDLVVDWLADLCAPPPPIRAHPSASLVAPRLDYNVIRHRLSRPSMRKYLDRFEYMEYKAIDMRSARRVAKGHYEPVDQQDLDGQLEEGFLAAEHAGGARGGGQTEGEVKKKRKYQYHNRIPNGGNTSTAPTGTGTDKERKKPGPKKGWKAGLTPEERERAKRIKRQRQSTTGSTGVKPEAE